ncbi:hypothetical protein GGX14DRAFT_394369 [Mycena pura]|uniref:Uncharacterized protein n=1 Tax=Mycena pura TaxID=153505 RepID=A0AAD6VIN8_9AGAR|nr:hypothetical protein GGX14DRAFT_394369 [Mycena pura]
MHSRSSATTSTWVFTSSTAMRARSHCRAPPARLNPGPARKAGVRAGRDVSVRARAGPEMAWPTAHASQDAWQVSYLNEAAMWEAVWTMVLDRSDGEKASSRQIVRPPATEPKACGSIFLLLARELNL